MKLSLAIVGTAAILTSSLAGPAMAKGTSAKGVKAKQVTQAQTRSPMESRAAYSGQGVARDQYGRPLGPVGAAGAVVGGAVATAGAIATAPFRAFDNSYNDYNNYYGYGYGGRDWKTYATRNSLACTPGTMFKGPDGRQHPCQ